VVEWAPSESQIPESTELTVPPSDVTDWIVVSEAGMAGGYTLDFVEELYADNGTENANESSGEGLPTNNETDAAEGLDSVEPSTLPLEG
jgi:hypothetical protein